MNGAKVANRQFLDTVQIPYWSGVGRYPSVKLRMDFRGPTVGDFVYHCHILGHEDGGINGDDPREAELKGRRLDIPPVLVLVIGRSIALRLSDG